MASRAGRLKAVDAVSRDDSRTQGRAGPAAWVRQAGEAVLVDVHARPGARNAQIVGVHGDRLKVAIDAPPVDGKANEALVAFFARLLRCPRSSVAIQSGATHRDKCVRIASADAGEVARVLGGLLGETDK